MASTPSVKTGGIVCTITWPGSGHRSRCNLLCLWAFNSEWWLKYFQSTPELPQEKKHFDVGKRCLHILNIFRHFDDKERHTLSFLFILYFTWVQDLLIKSFILKIMGNSNNLVPINIICKYSTLFSGLFAVSFFFPPSFSLPPSLPPLTLSRA